ncbi:MAG: hypothetical protein N3E37_01430 [Candidatus Micrarchaeota archaeon]|nr:hypothetical protein [Candidatus Micrarchaeota archaeon]
MYHSLETLISMIVFIFCLNVLLNTLTSIDWELTESVIEIKISYALDYYQGYVLKDTQIYQTAFPEMIKCDQKLKIVLKNWYNSYTVIC